MNDQTPEYLKGLFKHFCIDNRRRNMENKLAQPDFLKRCFLPQQGRNTCLKSLPSNVSATRSFRNEINHQIVFLVLPHGKLGNHLFFGNIYPRSCN